MAMRARFGCGDGLFRRIFKDLAHNIKLGCELGNNQSLQNVRAGQDPAMLEQAHGSCAAMFGNHANLTQAELLALQTAQYQGTGAVMDSTGVRTAHGPRGKQDRENENRNYARKMMMTGTTLPVFSAFINDLKALNAEDIRQLKELLTQKEQKLAELEEQWDELTQEEQETQTRLDETQAAREELTEETEELGESVEAAQASLSETENAVLEARQNFDSTADELDEARNKQNIAQEGMNEASWFNPIKAYRGAQVIIAGVKVRNLEQQQSENEERLTELNGELEEQQRELEELEQQQQDLAQELETLDETIEADRERIAEIHNEKQTLKQQITPLRQEISDIKQDIHNREELDRLMEDPDFEERYEAFRNEELSAEEFLNGNENYDALSPEMQDLIKRSQPELFSDIQPRQPQRTLETESAATHTAATPADEMRSLDGSTSQFAFQAAAAGTSPDHAPAPDTAPDAAPAYEQQQPHHTNNTMALG